MLTKMRIWLPDAPGVLGAVAAEIGSVRGNVVGLEVLERDVGVAIDELVVELPDEPGAVDAVCRGVRNVPGAGVEMVTALGSEAREREDAVLAAVTTILGSATPAGVTDALVGQLMSVFDLTWLALADLGLTAFSRRDGEVGEVPPVQWVAAFVVGSRSSADPANDTTGSGVFVEPAPGLRTPLETGAEKDAGVETGCVVCGGRSTPIRRRERLQIALLITASARFADALDGRIPGGRPPATN